MVTSTCVKFRGVSGILQMECINAGLGLNENSSAFRGEADVAAGSVPGQVCIRVSGLNLLFLSYYCKRRKITAGPVLQMGFLLLVFQFLPVVSI